MKVLLVSPSVVPKLWLPAQQPQHPWELANYFGPHPRPTEGEILGVGPSNLCFNKPSGDSDVQAKVGEPLFLGIV